MASFDGTLNVEPNISVKDNRENKAVQSAIKLIQDNLSNKNDRDSKNQLIRDLFEQGFTVKEPKGPRKIQSKLIQQVVWRMASRMKPLDFAIHGSGRPETSEKLVTDGVSTVMDKGGYDSALRDKNGAFMNLLMYGDAFIQVGTQEKGWPIVFNTVDNANVYTDTYCTKVRGGWGRQCRQMVVVFSYSWSEIVDMFPEMKNKAGKGQIPRDISFGSETDRDITQTNQSTDLTEVAHFFDINQSSKDTPNYTVFIGNQATVQKELKGKDYPFWMSDSSGEKTPYIPVLQFMCQPSARGFYNHGIGDMIYDLAIVSRRMFNLGLGHAEDNVYPITHINVPKGQSATYFQKLSLAYEMRNAGKKGFVAMEYDPNDPGGDKVSSEALTTQSLVNEWQMIWDNLTRELSRMGVNVDEIDRGTTVTATQILAEEESQNAFIKQIMEWNASESQFAVELTLDFIKDFISKKDKTPLNLTTMIAGEDGEVRADGFTLGMVAEDLKTHDYFVRINSRSGVIPSNTFMQAQAIRVLNTLQPGSPAHNAQTIKLAKLNDQDISTEDLAAAQQPAGGGGGVPEAAVAGTERGSIRPGDKEPAI